MKCYQAELLLDAGCALAECPIYDEEKNGLYWLDIEKNRIYFLDFATKQCLYTDGPENWFYGSDGSGQVVGRYG